MGPAACTVDGEKVHTNLLEESWWPPFSGLAALWEASVFLHFFFSGVFSPSLSPFSLLSSLPPFLPVGICFLGFDPTSQVGWGTTPFSPPWWTHPAMPGPGSYLGPADYKQGQTHLECSQPAQLWTEQDHCPRTWTFTLCLQTQGHSHQIVFRGLCSSLDAECPCQCPLAYDLPFSRNTLSPPCHLAYCFQI